MQFHRNLLIDEKCLCQIADDLIEIAENRKNLDKYELQLMEDRMKHLTECSKRITKQDVNSLSYAVRTCDMSSAAITAIAKKVARKLSDQYSMLLSILRKW